MKGARIFIAVLAWLMLGLPLLARDVSGTITYMADGKPPLVEEVKDSYAYVTSTGDTIHVLLFQRALKASERNALLPAKSLHHWEVTVHLARKTGAPFQVLLAPGGNQPVQPSALENWRFDSETGKLSFGLNLDHAKHSWKLKVNTTAVKQ